MMYNNPNKVRNIELPENLFSNLGETKRPKIIPINEDDAEVIPYKNENESYRERITKMYEKLDDLIPINGEIDDILYFNNYIEKGIVVKPKVSSLKQFWTEYRLIRNEKIGPQKNEEKETLNYIDTSNFDKLFNALSERVKEINKYIDELKEMKTDIDETNNKLQKETQELKEEKQRFMDYKKEEEEKLAKEKESLKINYDRLQTIINDLDNKLNEIER